MSAYFFIIALATLAVVIAVLGRISSMIDDWTREGKAHSQKAPVISDNDKDDGGKVHRDAPPPSILHSIGTVADAISTYNKNRDLQETARNKGDRITLIVLAITALFAIIAAIFSGVSDLIFYRQLIEMQDDNRPWIKIISVDPSDLEWSPLSGNSLNGDVLGTMSPKITLSNVGRSPALGVHAAAWGFIQPQPARNAQTLEQARDRNCSNLELTPVAAGQWGREIMFPGDIATPSHQKMTTSGFGITPYKANFNGTKSNNDTQTISLIVYGCADYMFGHPIAHHRTLFGFQAFHIVSKAGLPRETRNFQIGENVAAADIIFIPLAMGVDAN
nr:hypothetical protein [uncultured Rhodopila sp.]